MNITKRIQSQDIVTMPERYRATLFNSLSGFKSLALIGTKNAEGRTNISVFNSIVHIGANPPLLGMVFRPDTVRRHTLENILEEKQYTINHVHRSMLPMAHQASAKFDDDSSEFTECGFTEEYTSSGTAPYIKESVIKLMMHYRMHVPIPLNGTIFLIGEIMEAIIPESYLQEDGYVDLQKAGTLTVAGLDAYFSTELIDRYAYARPGVLPHSLANRREQSS